MLKRFKSDNVTTLLTNGISSRQKVKVLTRRTQAYMIWKSITAQIAPVITVFLIHLTLKCQAHSHFKAFVLLPLLGGVLLSQCPHLLLPDFLHIFNQFSPNQMGWARLPCSNKQPHHLGSLKQVTLHLPFGWLGSLQVSS